MRARRGTVGLAATAWIAGLEAWQDLHSVLEVTRRVSVHGKETEEVSYYISSMQEDTARTARNIRQHWHIENGQHGVLDVVYLEDDSR